MEPIPAFDLDKRMTTRLDAIVVNKFPHHQPLDSFEAVVTVLKLRLATRVLLRQQLSLFAGYILRAIDLGFNTVEKVSELLGVASVDLAGAGAELLQARLIAYGSAQTDNTRTLMITERGRKHLEENQSLLVAKRKIFHLHFEPLAKNLSPLDRTAWSLEDVRRRNVFALPFHGCYPRLEDLQLSDVAEAFRQGSSQREDVEIIELIELDDPYVEYLPVEVVVLIQPQTGDIRLAVFDGPRYLERASYELTRAYERGELVMPAEISDRLTDASKVLVDLPGPLGKSIGDLLLSTHLLQETRKEVERREALVLTTSDREEREQLLTELDSLRVALEAANAERTRNHALLTQNMAVSVRSINTEDHRPLLFDALQNAKSEVIVISPWMNTQSVNIDLCRAIRQATDRDVRVRIGFGFRSHRPQEQQRNDANVRAVLDLLRNEMRGGKVESLEIVDLEAIHHKVLFCDRRFCVIGSFNWLSYRGDLDSGFRQEVGCVVEGDTKVQELAVPRIQEMDSGRRIFVA